MEPDARADTPPTRLPPTLLCGVEQEVSGSAVIKGRRGTSSLIGTQPLSKEAGSLHPDVCERRSRPGRALGGPRLPHGSTETFMRPGNFSRSEAVPARFCRLALCLRSSAREVAADTPNRTVITRPPSGPGPVVPGVDFLLPAARLQPNTAELLKRGQRMELGPLPGSPAAPAGAKYLPTRRSAAVNRQYVGIPQPSLVFCGGVPAQERSPLPLKI